MRHDLSRSFDDLAGSLCRPNTYILAAFAYRLCALYRMKSSHLTRAFRRIARTARSSFACIPCSAAVLTDCALAVMFLAVSTQSKCKQRSNHN